MGRPVDQGAESSNTAFRHLAISRRMHVPEVAADATQELPDCLNTEETTMKTIIAIMVSMALLLSTPFAMARGGSSMRANLDRIWKSEQAQQKRIDQDLDNIGRDVDRSLSQSSRTSGDRGRTIDPGSFKP